MKSIITSKNAIIKLSLQDLKNSINSLYSKKKQYNQIIQKELLMNKLSENIDKIFEIKHKSFAQIIKNINYINNIFFDEEKKFEDYKIKFFDKYNITQFWFAIDSIFLLKKLINYNKHIFIKKYFIILLLLHYFEIISLNLFKLILEIYIKIIIDLIIIDDNNIYFLDDLISGLIDFLKRNRNEDKNILYFIISILTEFISDNDKLLHKFQKSTIFLKFLNYKSCEDKYENDVMLISFLFVLYKNNITTNIFFQEIYKYGILDLNYYSNSISLLSSILKEEYTDKMNYSKFIIRKGFYIYKNNPIFISNISIKKKELSIIFSFKLINEENNDITIFNFTEHSKNNKDNKDNNLLSFLLCKNKNKVGNYFIKITSDKNEWTINEIQIMKGYDYIICITKGNSSSKNMELTLYINDVNDNNDSLYNNKKNNEKNCGMPFRKFVHQLPNKNLDEVKLKLGEINFEGIIGDFFIINKKLIDNDISYLFNLNSHYAIIAENIDVYPDLINHLNYFYLNKAENINHFKKLNFFCVLKIIANKLSNYQYINAKDVNNYSFGIIKYYNEGKIETFFLNDTLSIFINGNGVEFLVFQLHNLFSIFDKANISKDELYIFNLFLYQTLKLYYDIILIMSNEGKKHFKLNYSLQFDYFFLSFLTILNYYQKINKYLRMNLDIYNLLIEFSTFCDNNYYVEQRNLILSILLDEKLFNQKKVINECKILENLDFILAHILDEDEDEELFDDEILYKILNLQFILQSKEYNHKIYMKIILSLITSKKAIVVNMFNYIANLKYEDILYHYLKTIYINFEELKSIIKTKNIYDIFINYVKNYKKIKESCNCPYCIKIPILIYLLKDKLKILPTNLENLNKTKNIEISYNLIRELIYEIKSDFIICFNLPNEKKFKFVKNYGNDISNLSKEKEDNQNQININIDNNPPKISKKKSSIILSDLNLIQKINKEKFFSKFDYILKKINFVCTRYSKIEQTSKEKLENMIKSSIFEVFKFFFTEIISQKKNDPNTKKLFVDIFNHKNLLENFFKIYLSFDYTNGIEFLNFVIESSIMKIKLPFYFNYLNSEDNNEYTTAKNNIKIRKGVTQAIINVICKITKFEDVININRERLLIVIKDKYLKGNSISDDEEKFIIGFIISLTIKKLSQYNYFYLIDGEYYNFFELQIDILFEIYKANKYDEQYMNIIYGFLLSNKNDSHFYLNDMKLLKNEKANNENNFNNAKDKYNDRYYVPNLLNTLYFLIYFLSFNKNEEKDTSNENKNKFIKDITFVLFNNCIKLFEYINQNKLSKKFLIKVNIPKLEIYTILYTTLTTKNKKNFSIKEFTQYYETKLSEISNNNRPSRLSQNQRSKSISFLDNAIQPVTQGDFKQYHSQTNLNIIMESTETNEIKPETEEEIKYNHKIKEINIKSILKKKNIPMIYYNKLINNKQQDSYTKILTKPKNEFFYKTFIFSLKDTIFHNKNFINLSKSFKAYTKNLILEQSSPIEEGYYLNYPTKVKNFICDEYYRPFLKPDLKFFNRNMLKISHSYISPKKFEKIKNKFDITKIKFINFLPINEQEDENQLFICENIGYRGSILGNFHLKENFLFFKEEYDTILAKTRENPLFFTYSFQDIINHVKILEKSILIFYNDIKEVFLRRFFLKRFGLEIFLKDGRSYLFNFFNFENFNKFTDLISKKGVIVINDPVKTFDKRDYKNKYKKGELSNFQYLLLLNKFSTRTYNDINQYLVFPVLLMNFQNNIKRDLSKAICLNKEEKYLELNKYIDNYKILGYYFNNHYSTSAYVLYYLVRLIPYTYLQIDFQSGKFDVPERIFNNYNSYTSGIIGSTENRELIPELFHSYETCLNLNHNNFGKMNFTKDQINNFNSNRYKTCVEFIVNHRKILENTNIVPWINNIFGYNQINSSKELMNIFPLTSYEQVFDPNIQKIKDTLKNQSNFEIYREIRYKLAILDIGISPVQLFKTPHPEKNVTNINNSIDAKFKRHDSNSSNSQNSTNNTTIIKEMNISKIKKEKKKKEIEKKENDKKILKLFSSIQNFISKQNATKYKLYINDESMNLFFIFSQRIIIYNIFNMYSKLEKDTIPKIKYPIELSLQNKLINLEQDFCDSACNIFCELMPGFYCICRNENRTLKFINFNQKYLFSFLWTSVITSIEPLFESKINTKFFGCDYNKIIFFGDEEGFLCTLKCSYEYIFNDNEIKQPKMKILQKVKIHENSINIIRYNQRLNIIITSSLSGDIAINNAENLEIINMIKIGKKYLINNIKITSYDLLYVGCYNNENKNYYIKCYTLNGIKVTQMKSQYKIVNFFINESIFVHYENKSIDIFSLYDLKKNEKNEDGEELDKGKSDDSNLDDFKIISNKLVHCLYGRRIKKFIKINSNNILTLDD